MCTKASWTTKVLGVFMTLYQIPLVVIVSTVGVLTPTVSSG